MGIVLRFYYFFNLDSWFDEWNMIYTVDPSISNEETWQRFFGYRGKGNHFLPEYYPPINAFILKYFLLYTGYYTENARIYSLLFGCSSIFLVHILSAIISKNNQNHLSTFLFSINLFLIWQSNEIRPHAFVLFFSLLNIILFIKILNKELNFFYTIVYVFFSLLLLSSWPFALTIYFGKSLYILIHKNIKKISLLKFFLLFSIILISYIFINHDYLIYHLQRDSHYTNLESSFFYSFHFRSFFGSIFMGAIFLIIFTFYLFKDFKKNLADSSESNILIYIIISSYFLTILYSILKAGVISPKYIIFVLPLIIIWVSYKIKLSKFNYKITVLLIMINILNTAYFFFDNPIDRPPFNKVIKEISKSKTLHVTTNDTLVFNNAFKNNKAFSKNNLVLFDLRSEKILEPNEIKLENTKIKDIGFDEFWFLCQNNPRFAKGNNELPVPKKCKIFDNSNSFNELTNIEIEDFILKKYKKK